MLFAPESIKFNVVIMCILYGFNLKTILKSIEAIGEVVDNINVFSLVTFLQQVCNTIICVMILVLNSIGKK